MSLTKGKNRILLHLHTQKTFEEIGVKAPYTLCQKGIAEAANLSRNRTSELIRELIDEDMVKEDVSRVIGLERRRKIYSLTHDGRKNAEKIKEELEKKEVKLKMESSEVEVKLKEIDSYICSREPLLVAINKLNNENIIDLTKSEGSPKDTFTGRKKEIGFLADQLEKADDGQNKAVLIKGEAGIGKTRLVTEFKNKLLSDKNFSEDVEFITGKGVYEISEPYIPLKEAFKKLKKTEDEFFDPFNSFTEDSNSVMEDESGYKREILYSKTIKKLKNLCQNKLLIIFIDDLQWVDKASLKLLHHTIEKLRDSPLLFIGAYRPEDVDENDFLKEVIQRMSRQHLFKELEMEPLGWEDTKNIIQNNINSLDVNDEFIQLIHETAEGNPLFIKELVKQMMEDDIIDPSQGKYLSGAAEIDLPRVISDIIERRVKKLNDETLKILRMGSVIGEEIPFSLLYNVSDKDPFDLLENIDILTGNGLWEEAPLEDRYMFSHGLIHKSIYEKIPKSFKKEFHVSVAEELKNEFEENIEQHYLDIAYHYKLGEVFDNACEFYLLAAQRARNLYAHEDAIEMYHEALGLAEKADLEKKKRIANEGLGDCYKILGEYKKSMEYYDNIPLDQIKPKAQQKIYRKIASIHEREGEFERTLRKIEKGLSEDYQVSRESCRLLCKKGNAKMRQGYYDSAIGDFESALSLCQNHGDDKEYAQIHQGLGNVYHYKGNYDKAKEHLEEALKTWRKIDNLGGESAALNSLGIIHLNKGELDKALNYYEKSLEKRKKRGDKRDIYSTLNNIGTIYLRKGNFEEAKKYYKKSLSTWDEIGDKQGIAITFINLGEYHFRKGDFEKALKKQSESLEICRDINFKKGEAASLSNLGKIHYHIGDFEKSLDYYEKSLELCQDIGFKPLLPHPYRGLAQIFLEKGKTEKALDHAKTALDISLETDSIMEEGIVRKVLGIIYREMEKYEEAEKEFERSKKIFENVGERKELALSLNELSILKGLTGEEEEKKTNFEKSVSILESLNLEFWLEKVKSTYS